MPDETAQSPGTPAQPAIRRSIQFVIDVVSENGRIDASCQPTLHRFLIDQLPVAGFHAMTALAKSVELAIAKGPTDEDNGPSQP